MSRERRHRNLWAQEALLERNTSLCRHARWSTLRPRTATASKYSVHLKTRQDTTRLWPSMSTDKSSRPDGWGRSSSDKAHISSRQQTTLSNAQRTCLSSRFRHTVHRDFSEKLFFQKKVCPPKPAFEHFCGKGDKLVRFSEFQSCDVSKFVCSRIFSQINSVTSPHPPTHPHPSVQGHDKKTTRGHKTLS